MMMMFILFIGGMLLYVLLRPLTTTNPKTSEALTADLEPVLPSQFQFMNYKPRFQQTNPVIIRYHFMNKSVRSMENAHE
ncbi:MAG: hypothetical protein BAA01_15945 [Bacillus thermozeamaize]|uniref:Uncharacterized protein n=1 Tax=Bacillus thermozeamaize TaxID=230954 RepID=A0A1Y3PW22_9BACI|nr:MAG: hypothetical protein BAA01_15945 [Bacillus thermozeamaize]